MIFSTYEEAKDYAISRFIPVDRVNKYKNSWAIQIYTRGGRLSDQKILIEKASK